jgi:hypothetical protein
MGPCDQFTIALAAICLLLGLAAGIAIGRREDLARARGAEESAAYWRREAERARQRIDT